MKKEFRYTLKSPIEVHINGKSEPECCDIVVKGPRPKDNVTGMGLESCLVRSVLKGVKVMQAGNPSAETKEAKDLPEDEVINFYSLCISVGIEDKDIQRTFLLLRDLLCEGNTENPQCTIDGEKMTKPLFDDIEMNDLKKLIVLYFYHFLSSALK